MDLKELSELEEAKTEIGIMYDIIYEQWKRIKVLEDALLTITHLSDTRLEDTENSLFCQYILDIR
jgi:predicted hydrolase (HD superfamily)